jgi:hypothetical protein
LYNLKKNPEDYKNRSSVKGSIFKYGIISLLQLKIKVGCQKKHPTSRRLPRTLSSLNQHKSRGYKQHIPFKNRILKYSLHFLKILNKKRGRLNQRPSVSSRPLPHSPLSARILNDFTKYCKEKILNIIVKKAFLLPLKVPKKPLLWKLTSYFQRSFLNKSLQQHESPLIKNNTVYCLLKAKRRKEVLIICRPY